MQLIHLFKRELTQEVKQWVTDDLISHEQGEVILARYGRSLDSDINKTSFGYYLLMTLGALFIGLALILIISHNWDEIPSAVKTLSLLLLTASTNLIGLRLHMVSRTQAANIWLILGSLAYGASIMLIAQIYHLGEHYPDGIYWWALGVLPMALLTRSRILTLLMLVLSFIWMCVEAGEAFFPTTFPVFVLSSLFLSLYARPSKFIFLLSLVGMSVWLNLGLAWSIGEGTLYEPINDLLPVTLAIGVLLNGGAWHLMRSVQLHWREYGSVLHLWFVRCLVVTLLMLSFEGVWGEYMPYSNGSFIFSMTVLILSGVIAWWLSAKSGKNASLPIVFISISLSASFLAQAWLSDGDMIAAVMINLTLLLTGIGLIKQGVEQSQSQIFYTGIVTLLATAFIRYFDLIGDYIGGAILFLIAASIMMYAARYWRLRPQQHQQIDRQSDQENRSTGGDDHEK